MKKSILTALLSILIGAPTMAFDYYQPPNGSNMNFYPMMQHQMEKQETLDFINNPNEYKKKREAKDAQLDQQEGKIKENPYFKPTGFEMKNSSQPPAQNNMEFTKDEDGNIRIQGLN